MLRYVTVRYGSKRTDQRYVTVSYVTLRNVRVENTHYSVMQCGAATQQFALNAFLHKLALHASVHSTYWHSSGRCTYYVQLPDECQLPPDVDGQLQPAQSRGYAMDQTSSLAVMDSN